MGLARQRDPLTPGSLYLAELPVTDPGHKRAPFNRGEPENAPLRVETVPNTYDAAGQTSDFHAVPGRVTVGTLLPVLQQVPGSTFGRGCQFTVSFGSYESPAFRA